MSARDVVGLGVLALLVGWVVMVAPARADHMTLIERAENMPAPEAKSHDLDISLKLGLDGFRLGGRFFGSHGVAGLWLNGERRADGFSVDGRVQSDTGRAFNFKLDAEAMDAATRAAWRWLNRL
jgi:hypothetical protein